jgi:hypothetical protein
MANYIFSLFYVGASELVFTGRLNRAAPISHGCAGKPPLCLDSTGLRPEGYATNPLYLPFF